MAFAQLSQHLGKAAQPKLQRTWLRQDGTRRDKLSLSRVKSAPGEIRQAAE